MELFKISESEGGVYVRMLVYNNHVWYPWSYQYVAKDSCPTEYIRYARNFGTVAEAETWIKEHMPK